MKNDSTTLPHLYWPRKIRDADLYQTARRVICDDAGAMPAVLADDLDMPEFFKRNPDARLYFPVFDNTRGWWGELLGGDAYVTGKLIVSPECQLMVIERRGDAPARANELFAVEIFPTSAFFKKINSGVATVMDMLATDSGTIYALFAGRSKKKFLSTIESTGNMYLGSIGGY